MAAAYILYMYQHVFMGETKVPHGEDENTFSLNLKWNEVAAIVPVLILIFWIGLRPDGFFNMMGTSATELAQHIDEANQALIVEAEQQPTQVSFAGDVDATEQAAATDETIDETIDETTDAADE